MDNRYLDRLPLIENFEEEVCLTICEAYGLGEYKSYEIIETGYEDFNFVLETSSNKYFVKIFSKEREEKDCIRIVDLLVRLISEGVHHPRLLSTNKDTHMHKIKIGNNSLLLVVMDYIKGKTFFELNSIPNEKEIIQLAQDLVHINSIKTNDMHHIYDSWAIPNFAKEYEKKKSHLSDEERKQIEQLIEEFKETDIDSLPKALVHGDVLKTNVIKDEKGTVWIVDFSVANIYPRIIEIVIAGTHLLFDSKSKEKTKSNLKLLVKEYEKEIKLTDEEKNMLNKFIKFSYGIEYLNTTYEKKVKQNNSKENSFLNHEARIGLSWGDLFLSN